jgi:protease-4
MSDVAASGGYYVAAAASRVFALETTITGSIGVVALHFDLSGLLRWAGVKVDVQSRGRLADVDSPFEPWTDEERERLFASMEHTYALFTKRVAEGRDLDLARVDELGRGRVWSGRDAKAAGLVDELGGLHEALGYLRREASMRAWLDTPIRVLPRKPRLLDLILDDLGPDLGGLAVQAAERRQRRLRPAVPRVLDAALARLPLSLLLLHDGRPAAIADPHLEIE